MPCFTVAVVLGLAGVACSRQPASAGTDAAPPASRRLAGAAVDLPLCDSADRAKLLDGQQVRLIGAYLPVPSPTKKPRPGEPSEGAWLGQVVIELDGSSAVYDASEHPTSPARIELGAGFRTEEEIASFRGRRVSVEGRLVLAPTPPPDVASPKPKPALLEPARLSLVE